MSARDLLRKLSVFGEPLPDFATDDVPDEPLDLFQRWFREAVEGGVARPHLPTLATVDADGAPDARTLTLREVDGAGWWFTSDSTSPKAAQLLVEPRAALVFSWPEQGRQVRVRGTVAEAEPQAGAEDFLMRPPGARAASLVGRQSRVLDDAAALARAYDEARLRVADDPDLVADTYTLYVVRPTAVEFWQGRTNRRHTRLRYRRADTDPTWVRELLWP